MDSHEVPVAVDGGLSYPSLNHGNKLIEPHTVANRQEILEQQMATVRLKDVQDHVDGRGGVDLPVGESGVDSGVLGARVQQVFYRTVACAVFEYAEYWFAVAARTR